MSHRGVLLRLADEVSRRLDEHDQLPEPGTASARQDEQDEELERFLELVVAHRARSRRLAPRVAATPDELRALEQRAIGSWERGEREAGRDVREIAELRRRQEQRVGRSLTQYWALDLPEDGNVPRLLEELSAFSVVEWACRAPELGDAAVAHADEFYPDQKYLRPAPEGIGVEAAWNAGFSGVGMCFLDIEQSWQFEHPDLPTSHETTPIYGFNQAPKGHGTRVLGVVAAIDGPPPTAPGGKAQGVVGIAPHVGHVMASSWDSGPDSYDLLGALVAAIMHTPAPHVLLIEVQLHFLMPATAADPTEVLRRYPVELLPPYWAAIWMASALGIVVVEAAGNGVALGPKYSVDQNLLGGLNLDTASQDALLADFVAAGTDWNAQGASLSELDPGSPSFCDSGAVLVAACHAAVETIGGVTGHRAVQHVDPPIQQRAAWGSNYGRRVDCYAWGERVRTTDVHNAYTADFNGTSSAAAIVAGAALLVQQMCVGKNDPPDPPAPPAEVRDYLRATANGTPHVGPRPIGVMPDLAKIRWRLRWKRFWIVGLFLNLFRKPD